MFRKSLFTKDSHHDSASVSISMPGTGTGTVTPTGTGTVSISMTGTGTATVTPTGIGTVTGTCTGTGTVTSPGTGTGTGSSARRQDRSTGPRKGARDSAISITRSATELDEAAVRFKRNKESQSITAISFEGGLTGVLTLPTFDINDNAESIFLNLIAFERFHVGAGDEVTSYIWFMDFIDTPADVRHLQARRIVRNFIGSDKAAANLFNTISKDVTIDPTSRLGSVHSDVSQYCEKQLNRWRANLIHTYFTNPWTVISVVAAGVLFGLSSDCV